MPHGRRQAACQVAAIARAEEEAVLAGPNQLPVARNIAGHDRQPGGHRLEQGVGHPFGFGSGDVQVQGIVEGAHVSLLGKPANVVAQQMAELDSLAKGVVGIARQHQARPPGRGEPLQGRRQDVNPLAALEPPAKPDQQPVLWQAEGAAGVPARFRGGGAEDVGADTIGNAGDSRRRHAALAQLVGHGIGEGDKTMHDALETGVRAAETAARVPVRGDLEEHHGAVQRRGGGEEPRLGLRPEVGKPKHVYHTRSPRTPDSFQRGRIMALAVGNGKPHHGIVEAGAATRRSAWGQKLQRELRRERGEEVVDAALHSADLGEPEIGDAEDRRARRGASALTRPGIVVPPGHASAPPVLFPL